MHSCELITNLRAKKVLCHRVEVVKNFRCCNHRLCFLQRDWLLANCPSKSNQLNEAEESAEGHQTSCEGGVWARDYLVQVAEAGKLATQAQ